MNEFLRRVSSLSLLILWPACGLAAQGSAREAEPPRLVVVCSVDQLARWVFAEGEPYLAPDGGFRRLIDRGVRFTNCAYQHACTETGPGHATIGTGAPASVHGITRNRIWIEATGQPVYCVAAPAEPLPGLEEGARRGPGLLLAQTLAGRVHQALPGARTASVSWKDRSAILMAGPDADLAAWIELQTGNLVTNTNWCGETPAWLEAFDEERAIDSFYGKVWSRLGPEEAYAGLVDDRPYEVPHGNGSNERTLPQPLTGTRPEPDISYWTQLYRSPFGNEVVRLAAQACIRGMELGRDDTPDVLMLSFSSTDAVGHYFGADSVEARDALLRLDRQLGRFLAFLDEWVGPDRYALFLTADHGVGRTPEWAMAHGESAGRGLLQSQARALAEKALADRFGRAPGGRRYCRYVGEWTLALDPEAFARGDGDAAREERFEEGARVAAEAATKVRGMARAYPTAEVLAQGAEADPIREALARSVYPGRTGQVLLVPEPNWLDGMLTASHGTPYAYDREVVGFAYGAGIARGVSCGDPVTPGLGVVLMARLLGIDPPEGAVDAVPAGVLRADGAR